MSVSSTHRCWPARGSWFSWSSILPEFQAGHNRHTLRIAPSFEPSIAGLPVFASETNARASGQGIGSGHRVHHTNPPRLPLPTSITNSPSACAAVTQSVHPPPLRLEAAQRQTPITKIHLPTRLLRVLRVHPPPEDATPPGSSDPSRWLVKRRPRTLHAHPDPARHPRAAVLDAAASLVPGRAARAQTPPRSNPFVAPTVV